MNIVDTLLKIEINPVDICNRTCSFCPRSIGFKNTKNKINLPLAKLINKRLLECNYNNHISFSGFGEPLLHKNLEKIIYTITKKLNLKSVTVITNGDYLTPERAQKLYDCGVTNLKISMYDENREEYFKSFTQKFSVVFKHYYEKIEFEVNRNEMYSDFKLKNIEKSCYLPFYKTFIDFDGTILLCVNDWQKRIKIGNLKEKTLSEIWFSETLQSFRKMHLSSKRDKLPCNTCTIYGQREGQESFIKFKSLGENI